MKGDGSKKLPDTYMPVAKRIKLTPAVSLLQQEAASATKNTSSATTPLEPTTSTGRPLRSLSLTLSSDVSRKPSAKKNSVPAESSKSATKITSRTNPHKLVNRSGSKPVVYLRGTSDVISLLPLPSKANTTSNQSQPSACVLPTSTAAGTNRPSPLMMRKIVLMPPSWGSDKSNKPSVPGDQSVPSCQPAFSSISKLIPNTVLVPMNPLTLNQTLSSGQPATSSTTSQSVHSPALVPVPSLVESSSSASNQPSAPLDLLNAAKQFNAKSSGGASDLIQSAVLDTVGLLPLTSSGASISPSNTTTESTSRTIATSASDKHVKSTTLVHERLDSEHNYATGLQKDITPEHNYVRELPVRASSRPNSSRHAVFKLLPATSQKRNKKPSFLLKEPKKNPLSIGKKGLVRSRLSKQKKNSSTQTDGGPNFCLSCNKDLKKDKSWEKRVCINYILGSRYKGLINLLAKNPKFKRALLPFVNEEITKEVRNLCISKTSSFWEKIAISGPSSKIGELSWKRAVRDAEVNCPFLFAALSGATRYKRYKLTNTEERKPIRRMVAILVGLITFLQKPSRMRVIQELLGLELWLWGCPAQVITYLHRLGLTVSRAGVESLVKQVSQQYDAQLLEKKAQIEARRKESREAAASDSDLLPDSNQTAGTTNRPPNSNKLAKKIRKVDGQDESKMGESDDEEEDGSEDEDVEDLRGKESGDGEEKTRNGKEEEERIDEGEDSGHSSEGDEERHESEMDEVEQNGVLVEEKKGKKKKKNKLGYTLAFADINNKTQLMLSGLTGRDQKNIKFDEKRKMVHRCGVIDRIPTLHLDDKRPPPERLLEIDPSTFLPNSMDLDMLWDEYVIMTERIITRLMPCFKSVRKRVIQHIPHKYSKKSSLKSDVIPLGIVDKDQRNLDQMADILESFQKYVPQTESGSEPVPTVVYGGGQTCNRAREVLKKSGGGQVGALHLSLDENSKHLATIRSTYRLLYDVKSSGSVGTIANIREKYSKGIFYMNVLHDMEHALNLLRFTTEVYVVAAACVALGITSPSETPKDFPSEPDDILRVLFDLSVAVVGKAWQPGVTPDTKNEIYCVCGIGEGDQIMLKCDNDRCDRGGWFHPKCLGLSPDYLPEGEWFCCARCLHSSLPSRIDHVYEYSRAIINRGLGELVRHDAICENDGDRMVMHWKFDTLDFYRNGDDTYLSEGLSLLTDVSGGAPARLAHQLRWNRTINAVGGAGQNVAMDTHIDVLNADLEEIVRTGSGGSYPAVRDDRSRNTFNESVMVSVKHHLRNLWESQMNLTHQENQKKKDAKHRKEDMKDLVGILVRNKCMTNLKTGRSHLSFDGFKLDEDLVDKDAYLEKIRNYLHSRSESLHK